MRRCRMFDRPKRYKGSDSIAQGQPPHLVGVGHHDCKLFAAVTRDEISGPKTGLEDRACNVLQAIVARSRPHASLYPRK